MKIEIPAKVTFRPGPLDKSIARQIKGTGETPSQYLRRLVAEDCGRPVPPMTGYITTILRVNKERRKRSRVK